MLGKGFKPASVAIATMAADQVFQTASQRGLPTETYLFFLKLTKGLRVKRWLYC